MGKTTTMYMSNRQAVTVMILKYGKANMLTAQQTDETDNEAYWFVYGDSNTLASYQTDTNRGGGGGD